MLQHRSYALLAVLAALLLPSCGSTTATIPDILRSNINITVIPTPVEGIQDTTSSIVSASYRVNLQELNGLGCEVQFVSSSVFDPATGLQAAINYYDATDVLVFVGSKRIEASQSLVVPQSVTYKLADLSKQANLAILVQVKDDRGNITNQSIQVQIQ